LLNGAPSLKDLAVPYIERSAESLRRQLCDTFQKMGILLVFVDSPTEYEKFVAREEKSLFLFI
jgi:hypothetical protein